MENLYQTGEYWEKNSSFHEEDSDFKFQNFMVLVTRNPEISISGIVDLGCGAGRITWNFSNHFKEVSCVGVDLDHSIVKYASNKYQNENLSYQTGLESIKGDKSYNLVVLADVFEHIVDYIGFLQGIKKEFTYQLFNIPLDLSVRTLLTNGPIGARNAFGHLHFFYDKLALRILEDNGFDVIDYFYTDNISFEGSKQKGITKGIYFFKSIISRVSRLLIGQSKTSVIFGYSSLTVLCRSIENKSS
jgi:predicted TPR repeat methyltransferase